MIKLLALVAVTREILHTTLGIFRDHGHDDGSRLLPNIEFLTSGHRRRPDAA